MLDCEPLAAETTRKASACYACKRRKRACIMSDDGQTCDFCAKHDLDCQFDVDINPASGQAGAIKNSVANPATMVPGLLQCSSEDYFSAPYMNYSLDGAPEDETDAVDRPVHRSLAIIPHAGLDALPDNDTMQWYLKLALSSFLPVMGIFTPHITANVRQRAPTLVWSIALVGCLIDDPSGSAARPFLQRLSQVWTVSKNDGSIVTHNPIGAPSLATTQSLLVLALLFQGFRAHSCLPGASNHSMSFFMACLNSVLQLRLNEEAPDEDISELEREERRRTVTTIWCADRWIGLALLGSSPLLPESFLRCRQVSPDQDLPPPPPSDLVFVDMRRFHSMIRKNELYLLVGAAADLRSRSCCDFSFRCCGFRRNMLLLRFERWFAALPQWIKDLDLNSAVPTMAELGFTEQWKFDSVISWLLVHLLFYHAGVIVTASPRTDGFSMDWCLSNEFVLCSEHAIRSSALAKMLLQISPAIEISTPFLPYAILRAGLVHRTYIEQTKQKRLLNAAPSEASMPLFKEARGQLDVLIDALKRLSIRWKDGTTRLMQIADDL